VRSAFSFSLPWILARHEIPFLVVVVDPCTVFLVFVGIEEVADLSCSIYIHCSFVK
jgi:hypothetical protein